MFAAAFFMFWFLNHGWLGQISFCLLMIFGIIIVIRTWILASGNKMVITTERLVDINRPGIFEEIISVARYGDIKDMFVKKSGPAAHLLNQGHLIIETNSAKTDLEVGRIRDPQSVQSLIEDIMAQSLADKKINKQTVYNNFIKLIPELSEAEICEMQDLINDQLKYFN